MNSEQRIWNMTAFNKWKNWIILALIVMVVILFIVAKKAPEPPATVDAGADVLKKVELLKDENDKLYARVEQLVVTNAEGRAYSDSLAKALRLKPKFIKGVDKLVYVTDTIVRVDTVTEYDASSDSAWTLKKKDQWIDIQATKFRAGGGIISLTSRDTLTRSEVVKTGLFRKTQRFITVSNANPYNKLDQAYSWKIEEKKPWLTIGPYVGWDFVNGNPAIGVGVQIPIIQFKK